jgi:hypothetical protein
MLRLGASSAALLRSSGAVPRAAAAYSSMRDRCWERVVSAKPKVSGHAKERLEDVYGKSVFSYESMRQYLSVDDFSKLIVAQEAGSSLSPELADAVADGMVHWAQATGVRPPSPPLSLFSPPPPHPSMVWQRLLGLG